MQLIEKVKQMQSRAECLYTMDQLNTALDKMAAAITHELHDTNPLVLAVMTGALIPLGHLLSRLHFPLQIDYIHATRYRGKTRGGDLHWLVEPRQAIKDRTVLVFDDIMDGGLTLAAILDYCQQFGARKVYSAVMVNKIRKREPGVDFEPNFVGVTTEDRFLVGFGLDYEEYLRNIPGVFAVADEDQ